MMLYQIQRLKYISIHIYICECVKSLGILLNFFFFKKTCLKKSNLSLTFTILMKYIMGLKLEKMAAIPLNFSHNLISPSLIKF